MNRSKIESPAWKIKLKKSGAVAGAAEAEMEKVLSKPIEVTATATFLERRVPVKQTLTLGERVLSDCATGPIISVSVPGGKFSPGDMVSRESLPKKTKPVT